MVCCRAWDNPEIGSEGTEKVKKVLWQPIWSSVRSGLWLNIRYPPDSRTETQQQGGTGGKGGVVCAIFLRRRHGREGEVGTLLLRTTLRIGFRITKNHRHFKDKG